MTTTKVTDATEEPISREEALRHLRGLAEGESEEDLDQMVTDARTECENRTQRTLMPTTWLLTLDCFQSVIDLQKPPLIEISWIKYVDVDGQLQTLDPSAYLVNSQRAPAQVTPAHGLAWPVTRRQAGAVTIQYRAGYADPSKVPAPLKRWIKLALTDFYENRGRSSERPVLPNGFADSLLDYYTVPVI